MTVIYQTIITRIGASATDALSDQMLITFREGAPADLEEYCFIHCHGELKGELHPGLQFTLGQHRYPVTAVGSVAEDNLRELGHVTLRFDGLNEAEFPGTVHVAGPVPDDIAPGSVLKFESVNASKGGLAWAVPAGALNRGSWSPSRWTISSASSTPCL